MTGNLLPNNRQRDGPPKQFFVCISHVSCTRELKRARDKMGNEIQEPTKGGMTHNETDERATRHEHTGR